MNIYKITYGDFEVSYVGGEDEDEAIESFLGYCDVDPSAFEIEELGSLSVETDLITQDDFCFNLMVLACEAMDNKYKHVIVRAKENVNNFFRERNIPVDNFFSLDKFQIPYALDYAKNNGVEDHELDILKHRLTKYVSLWKGYQIAKSLILEPLIESNS